MGKYTGVWWLAGLYGAIVLVIVFLLLTGCSESSLQTTACEGAADEIAGYEARPETAVPAYVRSRYEAAVSYWNRKCRLVPK